MADLSKISTSELVEELASRREFVSKFYVKENEDYSIEIDGEDVCCYYAKPVIILAIFPKIEERKEASKWMKD